MKKILMVIAQYYPIIGGAEVQAKQISEFLSKNGFSVFVITTRRNLFMKSFEKINNVEIFRLRVLRIPKLGKYILLFYEFFYLMFKGKNFDIFHCHQGLGFSAISVGVAKILKKPAILKISNSGEKFDFHILKETYLIGFILVKILKSADKIIYLNEKMKKELIKEKVKEDKLLKIPNGVDTNKFKFIPYEEKPKYKKSIKINPEVPIIIYIGTLQKKKNPYMLLKISKKLLDKKRNFTLIIVGDGPERKNMETLSKNMKIEKNILFYGRKESIEEFLFASDIFILPSFVEGISNSLLEAGSCGLPCVASDIHGNREVIENGINGFLISSADTDGFVNAIEKLLTNKEFLIKMGKENRKKIVENYSIDKIVEKYIALYNNLISKSIIK